MARQLERDRILDLGRGPELPEQIALRDQPERPARGDEVLEAERRAAGAGGGSSLRGLRQAGPDHEPVLALVPCRERILVGLLLFLGMLGRLRRGLRFTLFRLLLRAQLLLRERRRWWRDRRRCGR